MNGDVKKVLANWIDVELSPIGQLPKDTPPARWIAERFLRWWRQHTEGNWDDWLGQAELALTRVRDMLHQEGGWEKHGEALHECTHLAEALATLRSALIPKTE